MPPKQKEKTLIGLGGSPRPLVSSAVNPSPDCAARTDLRLPPTVLRFRTIWATPFFAKRVSREIFLFVLGEGVARAGGILWGARNVPNTQHAPFIEALGINEG